MDHVRSVKFHCSKNVKDFPRWKKLLGRADPEFRVTAHTKVCSNHFKYCRPTADDPHPSLYLKGYPGISTPAKRKPTRRKPILAILLQECRNVTVKSVTIQLLLLLLLTLVNKISMSQPRTPGTSFSLIRNHPQQLNILLMNTAML